jgi:hypothetical protein
MLLELENLPAIGPLAFEDAARIVQAVREYVELRILPENEFAVVPDDAVTLVEWKACHRELSWVRPGRS